MSLSTRTIDFLRQELSRHTGMPVSISGIRAVGGGSINNTCQLILDTGERFFLKLNDRQRYPGLFEKEATGLLHLAAQQCIRIPSVIYYGADGTDQWLLLEWIDPVPPGSSFWTTFGGQLARLHSCTHEQFGYTEDNYMGALEQTNTFTAGWTLFFAYYRLAPQVQLAVDKKLLPEARIDDFERLYTKLDGLFTPEAPSLLHGDLWSGNFLCTHDYLPVLIDPAVYYGHRSMDLAMTTLFGGFDRSFYEAYHYHFPLPANYREQWEICNLYPLLIHLNLFGQSYLPDIVNTLNRFR